MILKAKAEDGFDNDGNPITIFQVEGDPLNIAASGKTFINLDITVPDTKVQRAISQEDIHDMCSDEGVIKRNVAYATKNNIKWDHLDCKQFECTCKGPYCVSYLGHDDYSKCPEARWEV
jgi:hypothetical protein